MKTTVNIKRSDLVCINLAVLPKQKSTYISILAITVFIFGVVCWINGVPQTQIEWMIALISSIAGALGGMFFGIVCSTVTILFLSSSKNGVLGGHEYTLTAEGLNERTFVNEGLNKWTGITEVRIVGSYLLFQITGYLFHIVPARGFDSQEDFHEFASTAMELWRNAKRNPSI